MARRRSSTKFLSGKIKACHMWMIGAAIVLLFLLFGNGTIFSGGDRVGKYLEGMESKGKKKESAKGKQEKEDDSVPDVDPKVFQEGLKKIISSQGGMDGLKDALLQLSNKG